MAFASMDETFDHNGDRAGFFGKPPTTKSTVTADTADLAALVVSFLNAVASLGLVTNGSVYEPPSIDTTDVASIVAVLASTGIVTDDIA